VPRQQLVVDLCSGKYFALKAMSRRAEMIGNSELGMADIKGKMHENARLFGGATRRPARRQPYS